MTKTHVAIVLVVGALLGCQPEVELWPDARTQIDGVVVDHQSGQPIEATVVLLERKFDLMTTPNFPKEIGTVNTTQAGRFSTTLNMKGASTYSVAARADGYAYWSAKTDGYGFPVSVPLRRVDRQTVKILMESEE